MPLIRKPSGAAPADHPPADLASTSPDERWAAARRLTTSEDVPALSAALERETTSQVREAIFTSLARIGGPAAAQVLSSQIRSDDASLRTGALDALRGMEAEVGHVLSQLLSDPDPDVRLLACELARALPAQEAAALMSEMLLREREGNVAAAAIEILAETGDRRALPALDRSAERFAAEPFLIFAIRVARDRIGAQ